MSPCQPICDYSTWIDSYQTIILLIPTIIVIFACYLWLSREGFPDADLSGISFHVHSPPQSLEVLVSCRVAQKAPRALAPALCAFRYRTWVTCILPISCFLSSPRTRWEIYEFIDKFVYLKHSWHRVWNQSGYEQGWPLYHRHWYVTLSFRFCYFYGILSDIFSVW